MIDLLLIVVYSLIYALFGAGVDFLWLYPENNIEECELSDDIIKWTIFNLFVFILAFFVYNSNGIVIANRAISFTICLSSLIVGVKAVLNKLSICNVNDEREEENGNCN